MESQGQNKAPELLYHYTSVSALYNMLVHLRAILMSSIKLMRVVSVFGQLIIDV